VLKSKEEDEIKKECEVKERQVKPMQAKQKRKHGHACTMASSAKQAA